MGEWDWLERFPVLQPDERTPCCVCVDCGAGPFAILAEAEPEKARCSQCRGLLEILPEVRYEPGMQLASPPLIEPGSPAWGAIAELRANLRPADCEWRASDRDRPA